MKTTKQPLQNQRSGGNSPQAGASSRKQGDAHLEALQANADNSSQVHQLSSLHQISPPPNHTGLPDQLKEGAEKLSGLSMDDVKVHFNSSKPAEINAHAFAQGTNIHLGPGQEHHLPHEVWHTVQQKQGRVRPTAQLKGAIPVNDEKHLRAGGGRDGCESASIESVIKRFGFG